MRRARLALALPAALAAGLALSAASPAATPKPTPLSVGKYECLGGIGLDTDVGTLTVAPHRRYGWTRKRRQVRGGQLPPSGGGRFSQTGKRVTLLSGPLSKRMSKFRGTTGESPFIGYGAGVNLSRVKPRLKPGQAMPSYVSTIVCHQKLPDEPDPPEGGDGSPDQGGGPEE